MEKSALRLIPFWVAFLAIGCEQRDTSKTQKASRPPQIQKVIASETPTDLGSLPAIGKRPTEAHNRGDDSKLRLYSEKFSLLRNTFTQDNFRSTPRDALNAEWRHIVTSIAQEKGVDESTVLAEFYQSNRDDDAIPSLLGLAYTDHPKVATESFLKGLEGKAKSDQLSSFSATLSDSKNIAGLEEMYDMVPPGKDRSPIADTLIRTVCRAEGIDRALNRLNSLDFEEERRLAVLGMISVVREMNELPPRSELNRFYEAAKGLGFEDIARRRIEGPAIKPSEED